MKDYIEFVPSHWDKLAAGQRDRKHRESVKKGLNDTKKGISPVIILKNATRLEARRKATDMSYAFGRAAETAIIRIGGSPVAIKRDTFANVKAAQKAPVLDLIGKHSKFRAEPGWIQEEDGSYTRTRFMDKDPENIQEHTFDNFIKKKNLFSGLQPKSYHKEEPLAPWEEGIRCG